MPKLKTGIQLYETSQEELATLAKKKNAPQPVSPMGAKALGANPDQAKMAGSRQQKDAVFKNIPRASDDLATAIRRDGGRTSTSAAEASTLQKAKTLQNLSNFDASIQSAVEKHLSSIDMTPGRKYDESKFTALDKTKEETLSLQTKVGEYADLLDQVIALEADGKVDEAAALNQQVMQAKSDLHDLGIPVNEDPLAYLATAEETISEAGAAELEGQLTLGELSLADIGFSEEEMEEFIGTDWMFLTVEEMQQRVEELQAAQFSRVQSLQTQLRNLPSGSVQREAVLRELKALAAVGIWGAEEDMDYLVQQMDDAVEVDIGGESFSVSEILQNDELSTLIDKFLNPKGDEDFKEALREQLPDFTDWIDENMLALEALSVEGREAGESFEEIQETTQAMSLTHTSPTCSHPRPRRKPCLWYRT